MVHINFVVMQAYFNEMLLNEILCLNDISKQLIITHDYSAIM